MFGFKPLLFSIVLSVLIVNVSLAQSIPDLTGYWNGIAQVKFSSDISQEYHFEQNGALLSGHSIAWVNKGQDSSKVILSGTVTSKSVEIKQTAFVYNASTRCLSNVSFKYSKADGQEKLIGQWYGDWSINTCPPGTSGKIELIKASSLGTQISSGSNSDFMMNRDSASYEGISDFYGKTLTENLRKRKYYALIIGIDEYADGKITDLDNPSLDAKAMYDVLTTGYTFSPDLTTMLLNPSRDEIIDAFDELSTKINETDQLLIFYAGHGIWDSKMKQGYWLPSDASIGSKSRWLSNSTIRDYVGGISSKHTLLITDACFSGSIFKERGLKYSNGNAMLQLYKLPSRKAMTSGTLTTVPDKSVFMEYLLKNLKRNNQVLLSAEDLFNDFKIAVINNSANGQVPQYGTIGQVGDEGGDFIFLRRN